MSVEVIPPSKDPAERTPVLVSFILSSHVDPLKVWNFISPAPSVTPSVSFSAISLHLSSFSLESSLSAKRCNAAGSLSVAVVT